MFTFKGGRASRQLLFVPRWLQEFGFGIHELSTKGGFRGIGCSVLSEIQQLSNSESSDLLRRPPPLKIKTAFQNNASIQRRTRFEAAPLRPPMVADLVLENPC